MIDTERFPFIKGEADRAKARRLEMAVHVASALRVADRHQDEFDAASREVAAEHENPSLRPVHAVWTDDVGYSHEAAAAARGGRASVGNIAAASMSPRKSQKSALYSKPRHGTQSICQAR